MFVHADGWLVNTSPKVIVGKPLVKTVALRGLIAPAGIRGSGGHQHVKFLMVMLYGTGGDPHDCTE
ncbi:hypothetical protein SSZBM1_214 [Synechococcus phage S-SZBM1]|uniref:Uncharacterized protein n=1 Tax=Synechococcus phage S-SZBM1 TaxID=2926475 RepID=A0AC61TSY2_9CAUD|nr:hypothetical protein PP650_gp062 [Synechococcus phage S-SZBM1]UNH61331.1 hypothetical protein SSZBM1_214 [Synechococcus phage S-SZBM1]